VKKTLLKLNWRLILIHFLAIWFFSVSFRSLAYLYDYKFLHLLQKSILGSHWNSKTMMHAYPHVGVRISIDALRISLLAFVGLLAAFLLSLGITLKMRWFWLNSVLALLGGFVLLRYYRSIPGIFEPTYYVGYIKYIFPHNVDFIWKFGITGMIVLLLGFLLLFSKYSISFIDKGAYKKPKPDLPTQPALTEETL